LANPDRQGGGDITNHIVKLGTALTGKFAVEQIAMMCCCIRSNETIVGHQNKFEARVEAPPF